MQRPSLTGGFRDAPKDAAFAFRAVMNTMAKPGEINSVTGAEPPAGLSIAAGVVLLTLCDPETPVYLAPRFDLLEVRDWITFHTGAPFVAASAAHFALGTWGELPLGDFPVGSAAYPDRSATLIVEVDDLRSEGATLSGPGIKDSAALSLPDRAAIQQNAALFPRGLDFIFTCGDRLAALPRSTKVS
ncbi:phosphonate C-P lyase system protein PhnH [Sulfitobacter sp. S0837]|uniref:phosphonate C-P lyase system protein PhnH n=1 Tax=Sulfitobacter maritimus TaxID=2741719 RepID=UPI0015838E9C|nr:phosphonate C-P lyase system protein PhnH [Sulfitobacter maritimus]NUH65121.1 phosphonate C-P lyase system protein PhnH [Sulfitobacter maritimus]